MVGPECWAWGCEQLVAPAQVTWLPSAHPCLLMCRNLLRGMRSQPWECACTWQDNASVFPLRVLEMVACE